MKIMYLNTWCGRIGKPILDFIFKNDDIDIFCFQEVYHNASDKEKCFVDNSNHNFFDDVKNLLLNYNHYFRPHLADYWGLLISSKKNIKILDEGEEYIYKEKGYDFEKEKWGFTAKNLQYLDIEYESKRLTIMNFHGLYMKNDKIDTVERLEQSNKLISFIKKHNSNFILGGDFNLLPDSNSIKMISEQLNCKDLIKLFNIKSTRTSLYKKPIRHADYVFVSNDINIKNFNVLPDEISDHSPIIIEI